MRYPIQVPSQLAVHLKALRKARGLTQAALAARMGLSQARLARIENDPLSVSTAQLLALLGTLDVQMTLDPITRIQANLTLPMPTVKAAGGPGSARQSVDDPEADW